MQVHRLESLTRDHAHRATSERLLLAVAECAVLLVRAARWRDVLSTCLSRFGEAAAIDRISLYRFRPDGDDPHAVAVQTANWAVPGRELDGATEFYERLALDPKQTQVRAITDRLAAGEAVQLLLSTAPVALRPVIERRGVRSAMLVPVDVDQRLWGFCIMAQVDYERRCESHEIRTMKAFADLLAAAIGRAGSGALH